MLILSCVPGQKIQFGDDLIIEFFEKAELLRMRIDAKKDIDVYSKDLYQMGQSKPTGDYECQKK